MINLVWASFILYALILGYRAYKMRWYCPPPYVGYHNREWNSLCPYNCGCDGRKR